MNYQKVLKLIFSLNRSFQILESSVSTILSVLIVVCSVKILGFLLQILGV